jgi:hypothetical protein
VARFCPDAPNEDFWGLKFDPFWHQQFRSRRLLLQINEKAREKFTRENFTREKLVLRFFLSSNIIFRVGKMDGINLPFLNYPRHPGGIQSHNPCVASEAHS